MSRARVRVSDLVRESGIAAETVLERLNAAGIEVASARDWLPRSKTKLARRVLELGKPTSATSARSGDAHLSRRQLVRSAIESLRPQRDVAEAQPLTTTEFEVLRAEKALAAKTLRKPKRPRSRKQAEETSFKWPTIGPPEETVSYLSAAEIESIHWCIVEDFRRDRDPIDPPGVKSQALLDSASFRPRTTLGGTRKYPTVAMAAAGLFHAVVHNHPFHNGNKRTAVVALISFLDRNNWVLTAEEDELFDYVLRLAKHEVVPDLDPFDPDATDREVAAVARWIQQHIRRVQKGEFNIQFRALRKILSEFGCEFQSKEGNKMDILRNGIRTQITVSNDGMDVPQNAVHKVRKDLELDEAHGYDSEIFYRSQSKIPGFIAKYRKILERLGEYDRLEEQAERAGTDPATAARR